MHDRARKRKANVVGVLQNMLQLALMLTLLQQFVVMNERPYAMIRGLLYCLFGLIALISVFMHGIAIPRQLCGFIALTYVAEWCLLLYALVTPSITLSDLFELPIPVVLTWCAYSIPMPEKKQRSMLTKYIILALLLGTTLVAVFGNGFSITDTYFLSSKNEIGPMLANAALAAVVLAKTERTKRGLLYYAASIWLLIIVTILRARATMIALLIVMLLLLPRSVLTLRRAAIPIGLVLLILAAASAGLLDRPIALFWDSLTRNKEITDINDLTSGRWVVYREAIAGLGQSPLFGSLAAPIELSGTPHNYALNKMVRFGLLGALPMLAIYAGCWAFALPRVFVLSRGIQVKDAGLYLLTFSLITSLAEYSYPFGPGATHALVWVILGIHVKNTQKKRASGARGQARRDSPPPFHRETTR